MIEKLRKLLTKRDKQFLLGLLFFSIFISIIEIVGISAIMPFVSVATNFASIHTNEYYSYIYNLFGFSSDIAFIILFGILLILFYLLRGIFNLLYFYLLNRFTHGRYHLLSCRLFENYMGMPYQNFITKNSSILTKSIINEAFNLTHLISSTLFMISEVFVVVFIYIVMLYVNYKITLFLTFILAINAFLMLKTVSVRIKKAGLIREEMQKRFYEIINRSFGNFKLIKLQSSNDDILENFSKASFGFAKSNIINSTLLQVPRLTLEAIGFGIVVLIVIYLVWQYEDNVSAIFSLISMFILALYRLMPSFNRIMSSYNQILFYHKSLSIVYDDLMCDIEKLDSNPISFNQEIILENIRFEYEKNKIVLRDINLTIKKGEKIAFVGESGSGKSTLVDIIIGLYKPINGKLLIDGTSLEYSNIKMWRKKIGYIPQSIYLFDGTIAQNVAFSKQIDKVRVKEVLRQANILEFLEKSQNGIDTFVGEGGIKLSGGQKQRIAIARALYNDPEILVLDEATSALDTETEKEIMDEIYNTSKEKTLIIIAHRFSTLDRCEKIYKLKEGKVVLEKVLKN